MKKLKIKTISQLQDHIKSNNYPQHFLAFFSLECAEYAISFIKYPDERVVKCIDITTKYLNGNATLDELVNASAYSQYAAYAVSTTHTASNAAFSVSRAAYAAVSPDNASYAALAVAYAAEATSEKEVIKIFMKHYDKLTDLEKELFDIKEVP